MWFSDNEEFKQSLRKKQAVIQEQCDKTSPNILRICSLLREYRRKTPDPDFYLVIISKKDLDALTEQANESIDVLFNAFITHHCIRVDSELKILETNDEPLPQNNNEARRHFADLSRDTDLICFVVDPDAMINYFIDGKDYGEGIFYSYDTRKTYEERKPIDKLEEVLDNYRVTLRQQHTYMNFFIHKSQLKSLRKWRKSKLPEKQFIQENKHLLRNKPEECFREDIREYIKNNMRVHVFRESLLGNLDRLDIELLDEKGQYLYFLEIKWVGESINESGDGFGQSYKSKPRINPDAVRQVLGYIKELLDNHQNVKLGYLIVFDARKEDLEDTGSCITPEIVPEELREYFSRFKKLPDFRVVNINPR